jgi:phage-related protein
VHEANYQAYGYRRTWKALTRAREQAPRSIQEFAKAEAQSFLWGRPLAARSGSYDVVFFVMAAFYGTS